MYRLALAQVFTKLSLVKYIMYMSASKKNIQYFREKENTKALAKSTASSSLWILDRLSPEPIFGDSFYEILLYMFFASQPLLPFRVEEDDQAEIQQLK